MSVSAANSPISFLNPLAYLSQPSVGSYGPSIFPSTTPTFPGSSPQFPGSSPQFPGSDFTSLTPPEEEGGNSNISSLLGTISNLTDKLDEKDLKGDIKDLKHLLKQGDGDDKGKKHHHHSHTTKSTK